MYLERARSKKVSALAASLLLTTFAIGVAGPVAFAPAASAATGTLTGNVYNDYNNNGVKDSGEPGVQGAVVYAYDADGHQFGPATSAATTGLYTLNLTGVTAGAMRLELQSIPSGYEPSRVGTDNATTIRFLNLTAGATVNNLHFAIQKPGDYCQNNPDIATTVFCVGNGTHPTSVAAIFHSNYSSSTRTPAATAVQVGSVLGVAWNPVAKRVYTSAYVKRHAGLNDTWGADAIYSTDPATNTTSHWFDLGDLSIDVGQASVPNNAGRGITGTNMLSADPMFSEVGKTGIGDIETNGVDTLYVTNLFQRTVHAIAIPADGSVPTAATNLGLPGSAVTCTNGTARPFALAFKDGYVYSGVVCDAATGTTTNLTAFVVRKLATDTTTGGWAQVGPAIPLNYTKGAVYTGTTGAQFNNWNVWDDTFDQSWDVGNGAWTSSQENSATLSDWISRPTPMFADLAFDDDGSIVMGFRDRTGDMLGADNEYPLAADITGTYTGTDPQHRLYVMAGGDILRLCYAAGTYSLQGSASCANKVANGEGPSGGEYYSGDVTSSHHEISIGHVAIAPRSGQLLLSAMNADPSADLNSAGIRGLSNSTGLTDATISNNYYTNGRPATGTATFAKSNGMGDIEALCDAAPLEIGNRIWSDTNGDGIQDPAEAGIDGVTVRLYAASDTTFATPLGTAVTSGGGQYYFRTGLTDSNLTDNTGGGLAYRTGYVIRVGTAANFASGPLAGMILSPADQSPTYTYAGTPDAIDSDPASGGTRPNMGVTWYPTIAVSAASTLPGRNNHTYDSGFVPPKPYDLALRKTVVSMTGAPVGGSVTFQLEVFNQTADPVNGVTITDYIDTGSFKPMTALPAAGTTGGAAALAYAWENSDTSKPSVTISGVIPGNSSVTLNVTLNIATSFSMTGLVNKAEISKFDNDGNSANGDSTTGTVYDIDSIPDAVNTDALVDDVISGQRWTNNGTTQTLNNAVTDEDDHDVATVPLYDLALIKTRSAGQPATVTSPATTASFDITVKNQGQNAVYGVTVFDSPVSPLTRSATTAASQTVTTTLGASVTVTFNSGTGVFTIPTLAAGDTVKFTVIADLAVVNTVQVNGAEITGFDNDNNTGNAKPSWVQDADSTPDATVGNDAILPGTNPAGFPQDSHNLIDNAPVNGVNATDEDDQDTEAVQLGLLRIGSTVYKDANGNSTGDAGEEVAGVLVQLFKFNGSTYDLVASTVTNAGGDYSFDRLFPGTYQVGIPTTQTGSGVIPAALTEWEPVAGSVAGPETSNFDNDGDAETGFISRSDDVVLTYNGEPTNDTADNADADALTSPRTYTDANSNLNVDFVFNQVKYELGNLVWSDNGAGNHYNNGIADSDESGINGVTVQLYRDNGAGGAVANDGILAASELIATTVTAGGGFYDFKNLLAAVDYHVVVVKSSVPVGLAVAGTPVAVPAADGVDNDNNAAVVVTQGWSSGRIALGPVATAEATGETDGTTGADASPTESVADNRADQTVDFGFVPSMRIGNQVWRDESDNNPVTQVSTDNNGVFNSAAGEVGLSGVRVELWRDVNANGFQAGGDDVLVGFTNTDANGNYWFDGVRPGDTYFVAIHTIAAGPSTLDRPASSTGQSASVAAADNDDDGAPDAGSGYLSVSRAFVPTLGTASTGETDANQVGVGAAETAANARVGVNQYNDNDSQLRVDFGFVNVPVYRIGNLVWLDNGGSPYVAANESNGSADSNEPGISGVTVQLFAASDVGFIAPLATATTDANGEYAFENLVAGDYVVRIASTGGNATTLAGLTSTTDGLIANADHDNDDNGVVSSGGWASTTVTLNAANAYQGGEPETEAHRLGEATSYDNGLSWTTTTSDPATYANNRSNLTVDFGFTQSYRIGNLVWHDTNDDGVAQAGEAGIGGVLVQLLSGSTVVAETVTASDGKYAFTNLAPGDYKVRIPVNQTPVLGAIGGIVPAALSGLVSSDNTDTNANNDDDNDDNGQVIGVSSWDSGTVTLGGASEPTNERLRANDATDDDASAFADNLSNFSVDFGFWPQMRLGNTVWIDQSDNDPATYAATDNNGVLDAGEAVIANVGVAVWLDGGNGTFDAGTGAGADDTLAGTDITDSEGNWLVDELQPGTYFVAVETLPAPYTTYVSSLGQSAANFAIDNVDDGAAATDGSANAYKAVSGPVTLVLGSTPVLEADTVPTVDTDGDANAEAEANRTSGLTVRDSDSDLTIDLSFVAPPTYRIGNLVWRDLNADGTADAGEPGISGVLVRLINGSGSTINETVTDANGFYQFTADVLGVPLAGGDYRVSIPSNQTQVLGLGLPVVSGALTGAINSPGIGDPDLDLDDNDDNGAPIAGGWESPGVTLGLSGLTFESEPTIEVNRNGGDDDLGWAAGTDARSEFTVDFGFYFGLRLGDTVWFDDGRTGPGTYTPSQENDGIYQATELPAAGVDVELWADNGDGVFDGATDTFVSTDVTDAQGEYFFVGLDDATTYFAVIPSGAGNASGANNNGTVLGGWRSSTVATSATTTGNDTDHGDDLSLSDGYAATSKAIDLVRGGMAYGELADEANANAKSGITLVDGDSNLVVDFGFSPAPTYQLGNLVWLDANDNGIVNSGESGIGGVTVQLFADDGDGVFEPGTDDGAPIATDTTGTTGVDAGRYEFPGLAAGTYFVYLPKQSALNGMDSSQVRQANANNDVDNDNNAIPFGGPVTGYASSKVELGAIAPKGENGEPTGEVDGNTSATAEDGAVFDERSNQTVDFGFAPRARIGNQVWRDESDASNATHAGTDNNGVFDAASGEVGIAGVTVELWRDVAGDGIELGGDDVMVGTTTTNGEGNYWFDNLIPGANFYVAIPSVGSPLTTARSSAGISTTPVANDNDDDGAPFGGDVSVSQRFTVAATSATLSEADAVEPGDGSSTTDANAEIEANLAGATFPDASSELAVDFGFIEVPLYRIGNLVWLDANNNGAADSSETPIQGVLVQLLNSGGTVIAETTTGADGKYVFENLVAGDYSVRIPSTQTPTLGAQPGLVAGALDNLASSTTDATDPENEVDGDDNGVIVAAGWQSGTVTLGSANAALTETEPTTEVNPFAAGTEDAGWANGTDARSNLTVDFGFYELLRLGDIVWLDNGGSGVDYNPSKEDNGVFDAATETLISGVSVNLYRDNGDGVFTAADLPAVQTTVTVNGTYFFTGLTEGGYFVGIPDSELGVGQALATLKSSTGQASDFTVNDLDQGDPVTGFASLSHLITLAANTMNNGDTAFEGRANTRTGITVSDASSNLAVDFGFSPTPSYALGNLVWEDLNNNGVVDASEPGLPGISVELYQDNGAGGATAGDGILAASERVGTDVTDASGRYLFENLPAGDYIVRIPATETDLDGWYVGGTQIPGIPVLAAGNETDNDNNAVPDSVNGGGYTSGVVTLGEGNDHEEPTAETDANTSADAEAPVTTRDDRSDQTVDFGFWRGLRLGDIVWFDNGGSGVDYNSSNEDNGVFDSATETMISGVTVNLYRDNGDHVFNVADDALVDSTTTVNGTYYFTGLTADNYFVGIPDAELASGQELFNLRSSTGQASDFTVNDLDQGAPATGFAAVSPEVTLTVESMSNGDTAFESRANTRTGETVNDASSNLAVDFGFSPLPTYALGNLVWEDLNNNGVVDAGEPGISGISVELYQDNGAGGATAGDGILATSERVGTDVTDANGRYLFENLPAGDYIARMPATETDLDGWYVGGTQIVGIPVLNANNDVDNDNNAVPDALNGGGYTSGVVTLGEGNDHDEATGETDANTSADAEAPVATRDDRSDQTVDFGFWRGLRLGNQVWLDEGAAAHQNNGTYDADEAPLTGLTVELWADGGDSTFDAGAGDDTLVDSTMTGAEGRYFFEHVAPGTYFAAIASSPVGTVSSTGRVGTGLGDDGLDDGDATGGYVSVSQLLTLALGSAPTGELDGPGVTTDDAEVFANAATGTYPDDQSYLTADFGLINVPLYRIGNLIWNDGNNDGLAQTGEPGVDGVLVQLTDSSGTVIAETVTAGGGYYAFESLVAGTYRVQVPSAQTTTDLALSALIVPTALDGFHPSTVVSTTPADQIDNDSNGVPTGSVNRSGLITLGGTEPVTEQLRVDDATDDDLGLVAPRIDDDRSDFTIDFGYYSISLGNQVFFDANGNGIYEPAGGDFGIDGVTVILRDASNAFVDSTTTAGGGLYLFTGLVAGTGYYVEIPATEFVTAGDLNGLFSSAGDAGSTDDTDVDGLDRGVDAAAYAAVRSSGVWTASASAAPSATDGNSPNPDNDTVRPDAAENLVVDFGFYQMELGGTVFLDPTNDGIDDSDGDFADVTVLLYKGDGSPYLRADGSQASTVTDGSGNYVFSGLPVGQYIVEIPAAEFTQELDGYANSDGNDPVPSPDNDVTGEDNGYPVSGDIFSGGAVRSQVVTLNLAAEPSDDQSPTSGYADDMSNLSVDFGFWHAQAGLELGNQIWFDSDKDGLYNHGESPAPAGVVVQLLDADTLAVLATTTTDSAGQYRFTGLVAGRYIVKLPPVNFIEGGLLAGYKATDGAGVSGNPNDGTDSDSNAQPLSVAGIKSAEVTLKAAAPINEPDPASQGIQDRQSNLTVDFGLVLGTPESLAFTGAELPLRQAGLLFALGLALVVVSRRRREE